MSNSHQHRLGLSAMQSEKEAFHIQKATGHPCDPNLLTLHSDMGTETLPRAPNISERAVQSKFSRFCFLLYSLYLEYYKLISVDHFCDQITSHAKNITMLLSANITQAMEMQHGFINTDPCPLSAPHCIFSADLHKTGQQFYPAE